MINCWSTVRILQALIAAVLSATAIICFAGNLGVVQELIAESRFSEALEEIEKLNATDPDNPEVLFAKAIALDRSGNTDTAVSIYEQLTKAHPDFPEPFNNLAVLYAEQGDFDLALQTLEDAFNANESYRVTYQNLTAIYGKLASEAYRKALNSDSSPISLELTALEAISQPLLTGKKAIATTIESGVIESDQVDIHETENTLTSTGDDTITAATVDNEVSEGNFPVDQGSSHTKNNSEDDFEAVIGETVATAAESSAIESDQRDFEEIENTASSTGDDTSRDDDIETEYPVGNIPVDHGFDRNQDSPVDDFESVTGKSELSATDPEVQALVPDRTPDPVTIDKSDAVAQRVMSWANSWASQDLDLHLSHYSSDFVPTRGLSLDDWKEQKRGQVLFSGFVVVELSNLDISIEGKTASAQFLQYYRSNIYEGSGIKTLKLSQVNGEWFIVKEFI